MEIEVLSRKEQPLLGRIEIRFKITHAQDKTPKRDDVRAELAYVLNAKKERVVIDSLKQVYGKSETIGYAKLYENIELIKKIEPEHILVRNRIIEKKKEEKAEKKAAGKKEAEKK